MTRRWLIDLARIQPTYPRAGQGAVNLLILTALVLIPFAVLSVVLGRIRPDRTAVRTVLVVVALGLCTALSLLALAGLDSGLGQGNYRFVVYACYLVILAPIVATVVMARLASRRAIRGEAVPAITGAWAGGVMTTLTAVYLVVGVVQLMRPEPAEEPILIGGSGDLRVFFPLGSVILLIGLLTLGLGLFRLRAWTESTGCGQPIHALGVSVSRLQSAEVPKPRASHVRSQH